MKGLLLGSVVAAAIAIPATAGAVPPGNTSVPLGSTASCFVVATPAAPATCNFVGAGSGDIGLIGGGSGTWNITHQIKVVTCDQTTHTVSGYHLQQANDQGGSLTPPGAAEMDSWQSNVVYTVTLAGEGFLALGGQGT